MHNLNPRTTHVGGLPPAHTPPRVTHSPRIHPTARPNDISNYNRTILDRTLLPLPERPRRVCLFLPVLEGFDTLGCPTRSVTPFQRIQSEDQGGFILVPLPTMSRR